MKELGQAIPTLYLVPAPLGESSIGWILPPEVVAIVQRLKLFFVERERTARRFLKELHLHTPLQALELHQFPSNQENIQITPLLDRLESVGEGGILSEAGLPCIADPGSQLVAAAHTRGVRVIPLVGPSSILLGLIASGFEGQRFEFHGYLPQKKEALQQALIGLESASLKEKKTQIFIETPYRNMQLLESMLRYLRPSTRISVALGLTTPTEKIVTKTVREWKEGQDSLQEEPAIFLLNATAV